MTWQTLTKLQSFGAQFPMGATWGDLTDAQLLQVGALVPGRWESLAWLPGMEPQPVADTLIRLLDPSLTACLLYTSPSPRDRQKSRMPSSA